MKSQAKDDKGKRGATVIEHMLLGALIALVVIGAASALGGNLEGVFHQLAQNIPAVQ